MTPETQRLFFALKPSTALRQSMRAFGSEMRKTVGGRLVSAENIHLTLAFLGSIPVDRLDELLAIGGDIAGTGFDLVMNRSGCWKRSTVGWLAPEESPAALTGLVVDLRQRLLVSGFRVDDKPFVPHVTLVRKAHCNRMGDLVTSPLLWQVNQYVLMRSETLQNGAVYTTIAKWELK